MKEKKSLAVRIQKEMPEFFDEVASLDATALEARIVQLAKGLEEVEKTKDEDEGLQAARATARDLNAPYVEAKKAIRLKTSYICQLLEEKGK
jgi:hypothetical protein